MRRLWSSFLSCIDYVMAFLMGTEDEKLSASTMRDIRSRLWRDASAKALTEAPRGRRTPAREPGPTSRYTEVVR